MPLTPSSPLVGTFILTVIGVLLHIGIIAGIFSLITILLNSLIVAIAKARKLHLPPAYSSLRRTLRAVAIGGLAQIAFVLLTQVLPTGIVRIVIWTVAAVFLAVLTAQTVPYLSQMRAVVGAVAAGVLGTMLFNTKSEMFGRLWIFALFGAALGAAVDFPLVPASNTPPNEFPPSPPPLVTRPGKVTKSVGRRTIPVPQRGGKKR